jgi:hypothetical protein
MEARHVRSEESDMRFLALALIAVAVGWPTRSYAEA